MLLFALMMLPGLAFLIFVVIQFLYRGRSEADAANSERQQK